VPGRAGQPPRFLELRPPLRSGHHLEDAPAQPKIKSMSSPDGRTLGSEGAVCLPAGVSGWLLVVLTPARLGVAIPDHRPRRDGEACAPRPTARYGKAQAYRSEDEASPLRDGAVRDVSSGAK
jgi:hypothetical protein